MPLAELRDHPRNYRTHPDDQLEHIAASMREHGVYKNVVIARDGTILAGHGTVRAARKAGIEHVSVVRLDVDPSEARALKVLTGDNEVGHLAEWDDRALSELLKEIGGDDPMALLGTGYDVAMLANLALVTRPETEIAGFDEAAAWAGMPGYKQEAVAPKLIVSFRTEEDRERLLAVLGGLTIHAQVRTTWSTWWPDKPRERQVDREFVQSKEGA